MLFDICNCLNQFSFYNYKQVNASFIWIINLTVIIFLILFNSLTHFSLLITLLIFQFNLKFYPFRLVLEQFLLILEFQSPFMPEVLSTNFLMLIYSKTWIWFIRNYLINFKFLHFSQYLINWIRLFFNSKMIVAHWFYLINFRMCKEDYQNHLTFYMTSFQLSHLSKNPIIRRDLLKNYILDLSGHLFY